MNIQPINISQSTVSSKSSYPVVHWVSETNGNYVPVTNLQIVKKLQGKLIRMLNKPFERNSKSMIPLEQRFRAYIGACDADYRIQPLVRSFYNRTAPSVERYNPVAYIVSGSDVKIFENYLAKNIGREKGKALKLYNNTHSPEANEAVDRYNKLGLTFVRKKSGQVQDGNGVAYTLHSKFEIIRNKLGKIKDYKFVEARFLPLQGDGNSLGKM